MSQFKQDQSSEYIDGEQAIKPHYVGQIPQWTVSIGILLAGVLEFLLPAQSIFGPSWLLLVLEICVLVPMWIFNFSGRILPYKVTRTLSLILLGLVTLALASSVLALIINLAGITAGNLLLRTAALLWLSNVMVFGLWYWETDGDGPRKRHDAGHIAIDFLFPQQVSGSPQQPNGDPWAPQFFDYLYLAFNTATAFSPTDTYPMTRTAKGLMMVESLIALMIVGIIIGRVSNII
jgi:hypothetical protein